MKLALCLDGLPAGDLPAIAAEAERRGFRKVLAAETTGAEPFVACAAMAAATRSIVVGTGIARIHGRSAASTAMAAASLATLSGNRFVLGLGLQSRRLVGPLPPLLPVPPADLDGLRRNVAAILGAGPT